MTPCPCKSLLREALKSCSSPVGTEAVAGVMLTAMPESRVSVAVPVFLVLAAAVAVIVMVSKQDCSVAVQLVPWSLVGSGTWLGAVNVTLVLVEFAGIFPVVALHGVAVLVLDFPVESVDVVV